MLHPGAQPRAAGMIDRELDRRPVPDGALDDLALMDEQAFALLLGIGHVDAKAFA